MYLGAGHIYKNGKDAIIYQVYSKKDLRVIIDHFTKYPLITQKFADFSLFSQIFNLIEKKKHLTMEGLQEIVAIKASINKSLPEQLAQAFPTITPIQRPEVLYQQIPDPN